MGNAIEVTDDTFASTIADNRLVLVDFWADWCVPCKMVAPIVEELAEEAEETEEIAELDPLESLLPG